MSKEMCSMFEAAKGMARRYGQIGLAEPDDLVQTTMIKLLKMHRAGVPRLGWLHKAIRSAAMDAGRAARREERIFWETSSADLRRVCERADEDGYLYLSGSYRVREQDLEIDLMPRLKNMLNQLSKPLRQVLVLYTEGYSYEEIGQLTNTNVGTVRSRLHYARRRAEDLLGDVE